MKMAKAYRLEKVALPTKKRHGLYDTIINEFLAEGVDTVKVVIPERSAKTIQIGLSKAMQVAKVTNVSVSIRGGEVYMFLKG